MAVPDAVLAFLAQANSEGGGVVVTDLPKLDLHLYIQNYTGRTRFERLLFIGKKCAPLCVDALKAAVAEAKRGRDVSRYKEAWDCIRRAAPDEPEAQRDDAWIDAVEARNRAETARLEAQLRGYKNNLIKESIRMGNEDLGEHFESIGKLQEAAEHYSRMRQDAGSTRHILDCGQHLAYVSLERRDWASMLTHVSKALGAISAIVDQLDESPVAAYSKALSGIALMGLGHYQEAAASFFQIASGALAIRATMAQVASISDLAVYGSLTALATMDRQALRRNCLDNAKFRDFFETEPHLRKAMSHFVNGRYANCLSILESTRNDYLLDVYLHSHVSALFCMIRNKCITQYFVAFSCATIESLDAAFGQPGQSVEPELVDMICEGALHARIDSKDKLLIATRPDQRAEMQSEALEAAAAYEREAKERLRRIGIVGAGLDVSPGRKPALDQAPGLGPDESWYDDHRAVAAAGGAGAEGRD